MQSYCYASRPVCCPSSPASTCSTPTWFYLSLAAAFAIKLFKK